MDVSKVAQHKEALIQILSENFGDVDIELPHERANVREWFAGFKLGRRIHGNKGPSAIDNPEVPSEAGVRGGSLKLSVPEGRAILQPKLESFFPFIRFQDHASICVRNRLEGQSKKEIQLSFAFGVD